MLHMAFKLVTIFVENKNYKSYAICYWSTGHICVLWASKNYGSAAIKISLFQTSRHNDFLYSQVWEELTWASVIWDITKLDKELFHNFVSLVLHWSHKIFFLLLLLFFLLSAFVVMFWFI